MSPWCRMKLSKLELLLVAMSLLGSACAKSDWIDRTLVTVDVTGMWVGTFGRSGVAMGTGGPIEMSLKQDGAKVTGLARTPGTGLGPSWGVEGTVTGDVFGFSSPGGARGELQVSGDEMSGTGSTWGGLNMPFHLRRQSASESPRPQ